MSEMTMIERVADAMRDEAARLHIQRLTHGVVVMYDDPCLDRPLIEPVPVDAIAGWRFETEGAAKAFITERCARAAIEAMREPTPDMTEHPDYVHGNWSRRNIEAWIRSALGEP